MSKATVVALIIMGFLGFNTTAYAGTVNIAGTGKSDFVDSVVGLRAETKNISFSESGTYTLTLTDFKFGDTFNYLGVQVATSVSSIAQIVIAAGELNRQSITFAINSGDYYLSIFGITGKKRVGSFGVNFAEGDVAPSPVPLPPALVFMLTSLLGLISFKRQRKALVEGQSRLEFAAA